ncbi:LPXTG cell wall anchor domain-containing protein [Micromonospora mirobrigensis]|uniref:LPXTG-motif cell wall anchor domain-containing protein n=1 Tax=Micromonospora mirobrigensis TaxID=262898 RepID=A0A1C5A0Q1_9ACTN|nr:LPXTG cell wall anchor domain-containing protein [Micromonospora mirobrigensis]SCF38739.1 LPXTG-motif cell wall anchor domain-containing protein [Micromonospora mirobrigensis]
MPQRRHVARAALTAAAATASLAFAAPAWATASLTGPGGHNPPGDNGTVKIDGREFEDKVDNQPHVTCDFELEFFNFDAGQQADITLSAQPPSGKAVEVWSTKSHVISTDAAAGAENDHDEVIKLSAGDLDLSGATAHPKQGYHIKLDVDLVDGKSSDAKHKVFWLQPCAASSTGSPSPVPSESQSPTPSGSESGSPNPGGSTGSPSDTPVSPGTPMGGGGGGTETDGGLPLTGVAATSTALTGLALIGGGVALMVLRRRRDRITFTS